MACSEKKKIKINASTPILQRQFPTFLVTAPQNNPPLHHTMLVTELKGEKICVTIPSCLFAMNKPPGPHGPLDSAIKVFPPWDQSWTCPWRVHRRKFSQRSVSPSHFYIHITRTRPSPNLFSSIPCHTHDLTSYQTARGKAYTIYRVKIARNPRFPRKSLALAQYQSIS